MSGPDPAPPGLPGAPRPASEGEAVLSAALAVPLMCMVLGLAMLAALLIGLGGPDDDRSPPPLEPEPLRPQHEPEVQMALRRRADA